jgi:HSP20 family molecular chaperone IbpA
MRARRLELMHDYVRAIHRDVAGGDPPEANAQVEQRPPTFEEVSRRFVELEAIARSRPSIAKRVPPFSFAPPLDLIGTERELVVELGVPGVELGDVDVELQGNELTVTGARLPDSMLEGRVYFHAEIPRGPFRRTLRLPEPSSGMPRVEVENGIVRIRLTRANRSLLPRA